MPILVYSSPPRHGADSIHSKSSSRCYAGRRPLSLDLSSSTTSSSSAGSENQMHSSRFKSSIVSNSASDLCGYSGGKPVFLGGPVKDRMASYLKSNQRLSLSARNVSTMVSDTSGENGCENVRYPKHVSRPMSRRAHEKDEEHCSTRNLSPSERILRRSPRNVSPSLGSDCNQSLNDSLIVSMENLDISPCSSLEDVLDSKTCQKHDLLTANSSVFSSQNMSTNGKTRSFPLLSKQKNGQVSEQEQTNRHHAIATPSGTNQVLQPSKSSDGQSLTSKLCKKSVAIDSSFSVKNADCSKTDITGNCENGKCQKKLEVNPASNVPTLSNNKDLHKPDTLKDTGVESSDKHINKDACVLDQEKEGKSIEKRRYSTRGIVVMEDSGTNVWDIPETPVVKHALKAWSQLSIEKDIDVTEVCYFC